MLAGALIILLYPLCITCDMYSFEAPIRHSWVRVTGALLKGGRGYGL